MKTKFIIIYFLTTCISYAQQGAWIQKTNFGGLARYGAVGFSIGTKGYIGTGRVGGNPSNGFWEWNQVTNAWTQKANYGGAAGDGNVAFSIGSKGYIATGYGQDFWEWDQSTNIWTQKTKISSANRVNAVGFSIGTKGYVGTGYNPNPTVYYNDFWEWDQATGIWTQKANFSGTARESAVGFSIGLKGYIGTGNDVTNTKQDFWEWNQSTNVWTQKASFGGTARFGAIGFSIGTNGYIGTGWDATGRTNDFWEYHQVTNTWTQRANFGGTARYEATGFSIGPKGYIGTGNGVSGDTQDFWEFSNVIVTAVPGSNICSNQCKGSATATGSFGTPPYSFSWNTIPSQTTSTATGLCPITYTVTITDNAGYTSTDTVRVPILPEPPIPTICLVSVDSLSQYNIIMWDKTPFLNVDSFIVYREYTTNNYVQIGAVPYDSLSLFIDTVRTKYFPITGDPNVSSYRYKLQTRDTCGKYGLLSLYHNTVHMIMSFGNFQWNFYDIESSPNAVTFYNLKRDDFSNGNWITVAGVSGTQNNITDPQFPTYQSTANWRIETQWNITCTPSIKDPVPMTTINSTKSNTFKTFAPTEINESLFEHRESIFPNPSNGTFQISSPELQIKEIEVCNVYGKKNYAATVNSHSAIISLDVPNGIYFLKLISDRGTVNKKIIIAQ